MNGRDAVLEAFERLFDRAAIKLGVDCNADERAEAKKVFAERFSGALDAADQLRLTEIPSAVIDSMEQAIDSLSPAQVVGHLAAIPIAHQAQQLFQVIAYRAAESRLLDTLMSQADDAFGGN